MTGSRRARENIAGSGLGVAGAELAGTGVGVAGAKEAGARVANAGAGSILNRSISSRKRISNSGSKRRKKEDFPKVCLL